MFAMITARFFLDTEYTNGYFYRGDIFEIEVISESTHHSFHQYVKIPYTLQNNVKNFVILTIKYFDKKGWFYVCDKKNKYIFKK